MKTFYKLAYVVSFFAEFYCLVMLLGWLGALFLGLLFRVAIHYIFPNYNFKLMQVKFHDNMIINQLIINCLTIMSPISSAMEIIWK